MQVDWTFEGCDPRDESKIARHWGQVQIELEGKLAELPDPADFLRIAVEKSDTPPTWVMHAALYLPGAVLVAEAESLRATEGLDTLLGGLAEQIDQLADATVRVATRRVGLQGVAELLAEWKSAGRSDAFLSFLLPVAVSLGPYIDRELQLREVENSPAAGEVSVQDVIDEILVLAWDRISTRPASMPIDLWLMGLADQTMDRLATSTAEQSLDDETALPRSEPPELQNEEWDEWIEQATYRETLAWSELIPGEEGVDGWDAIELRSHQEQLANALATLPRQQRQALVLNTVHGFNLAEIADFQGSTPDEIDREIAAAVAHVRRSFERDGEIDDAFDAVSSRRKNGWRRKRS